MPTYDYVCRACEKTFEEQLKIAERNLPAEQPCPNCNQSGKVELVLCAAALMSPFRLDGLKKPGSDFRDRMARIKEIHKHDPYAKIKDY